MNYREIILKILKGRAFVICHKQILVDEVMSDGVVSDKPITAETLISLWCYENGLEITQLCANPNGLVKVAKKGNTSEVTGQDVLDSRKAMADMVQMIGRGVRSENIPLSSVVVQSPKFDVDPECVLIVEFEDDGQDFTEFQLDVKGKVLKSTPFQSELWAGAIVPLDMLKIGEPLPIHHPPNINHGYLKHKVKNVRTNEEEEK
jgi:hypothetical protein